MIFVPFVYNMMMKPLTTEKWSQVLVVWRVLWFFSERLSSQASNQILKRFLWISDFISEATITQLLGNSGGFSCKAVRKKFHSGPRPIAGIVRLLSNRGDNLKDLNVSRIQCLYWLSSHLTKECEQNNHRDHQSSILVRLKSMAQWINHIEEMPRMLIKAEEYRKADKQFLMGMSKGIPCWTPGGEWTLDRLNVCPIRVRARIDQIDRLIYKFDSLGVSATSASLDTIHLDIIDKLERLDPYFRKVRGENYFESFLQGTFLPQKIHGYFFNTMDQ